jgi:hypothetical protein
MPNSAKLWLEILTAGFDLPSHAKDEEKNDLSP